MNTVEKAYEAIAEYLRAFAGTRHWDECGCKFKIYAKMASGAQWLRHGHMTDELGGFEGNPNAMWTGLDAAMYLRDEVLRKTGHRIWGLTFTLTPDDKFKLEYDYAKPEGYEETDETIEVDFSGGGEGLLKRIEGDTKS